MTEGPARKKKKRFVPVRLIVDVTLDLHHAQVMGIARGNSPARARRGGASPNHLAVSAIPNAVSAKGGRPFPALHSLRDWCGKKGQCMWISHAARDGDGERSH